MLPTDAISIITNAPTSASTTLLTSDTTTTIISFYVNHAFNSETDKLYCGNTQILSYNVSVGNYQSFPVLEFYYLCNKNIYWKNGSENDDTIILNYLPYNIYTYNTATATSGATTTDVYTLIQNDTTGASFYVNKSLSYGDILLLTFVILFAVFGIVKVISDFLIPKRTDFKK